MLEATVSFSLLVLSRGTGGVLLPRDSLTFSSRSSVCFVCHLLQDKIFSPAQINDLMAASDYVVVSTPYTPATHHLVNAAAIDAMKPTGVLINVGRGKCIDEPALIRGEPAV
jgi:hypothetical protein